MFSLPFGEAPPPSRLLQADTLANFPQWPYGLDGRCPLFWSLSGTPLQLSDNLVSSYYKAHVHWSPVPRLRDASCLSLFIM